MTTLPKQFENYLVSELKVSGKTIRNYRADMGHFLNWAKWHLVNKGILVHSLENLLPHFSADLVAAYKNHHITTNKPASTANRRLSTLRNFSKYLASAGLSHAIHSQIENIKKAASTETNSEDYLDSFTKHLEAEGVSKVTLKNYLSDIRQFLAWHKAQITNG